MQVGGGFLKKAVGILGGDLRQWYLAQMFIEEQVPVYGAELCERPFGAEEISVTDMETVLEKAQILAAPIPLSRDGQHITGTKIELMELIGSIKTDQILFAGVIPENAAKYMRRRNICFLDYMKSEKVALLNAVATAEGAIAEAIRFWPGNLLGCPCLVLGYGKCGRLLALRLHQFGAKVSVYARRTEVLIQVQTEGMEPVNQEQLDKAFTECYIIFNTIPAPFLTKQQVEEIPAGHLLIELASGAGCMGNCQIPMQVQYIRCPGLPGRYAPKASADILHRYICGSVRKTEDITGTCRGE